MPRFLKILLFFTFCYRLSFIMYDSENSISVGDYDMSKELRLKIRDLKNKKTLGTI